MKAPSIAVITGFMASGKTDVATAAARLLGCDVIDLDHLIESNEQRSIRRIIDEDGEDKFRAIELDALRDTLKDSSCKTTMSVIALGGGAWAVKENRALITKHNCLVFWLDTPFEVCWTRSLESGDTRPLARHYKDAELLFKQRRPIYAMSHIRIEAGLNRSIEDISTEVSEMFLKHQRTS